MKGKIWNLEVIDWTWYECFVRFSSFRMFDKHNFFLLFVLIRSANTKQTQILINWGAEYSMICTRAKGFNESQYWDSWNEVCVESSSLSKENFVFSLKQLWNILPLTLAQTSNTFSSRKVNQKVNLLNWDVPLKIPLVSLLLRNLNHDKHETLMRRKFRGKVEHLQPLKSLWGLIQFSRWEEQGAE